MSFTGLSIDKYKGFKANYHTHTPRCGHAHGSEREYVEEAIKNDKKAQDGRTRFVLIKEIGEVI